MTKRVERFAVEFARKGGRARAKKLTSQERQASASWAANARWHKHKTSVKLPTSDPENSNSEEPAFVVEDVFSLDVRKLEAATEVNDLIGRKFAYYLERRSPQDYEFCVQNGIRLYRDDSLSKFEARHRDRILALLDDFILDQAKYIGARIFFYHAARCRLVDWSELQDRSNKDEHALFVRLGRSLNEFTKVSQGSSKHLIRNPELYLFKKDLLTELPLLAKKTRRSGHLDHRIDQKLVIEFLNSTIALESNPFERLNANLRDFLKFCREHWHDLKAWLTKQRGITTARIAEQFIADLTGYSNPESVRKATSRLGSLAKNR